MEHRHDIIYASAHLLVRKRPARDTQSWVITFDHYGIADGFDRPGFAEDFLAARGISVLTFLGRGNDWYQYPDMRGALAIARAALLGRGRVMTYGSSMGGYAAIRFADALGAHACLAISPQYSIDPRKVPFERRWQHDARRIAWQPELDGPIRCEARPVIIHDPIGEDGLHVRRIAADIACIPIGLPYTAHPATTYLQSVGALAELVPAILDGSFDPADAARRLRVGRKRDPVYLSELARRQPAWRPALGVALARRAVERAPGTDLMAHVLAERLAVKGHHAEALRCHARACDLSGDLLCYALPHALALVRSGDAAGGLRRLRQLAARHPGNAHLHHVLAGLLWTMKRRKEALAIARHVVRLAPHDPFYRAILLDYRWPGTRLAAGRTVRFLGRLRRRLRAGLAGRRTGQPVPSSASRSARSMASSEAPLLSRIAKVAIRLTAPAPNT